MPWTLVLHENPDYRQITADLLDDALKWPVHCAGNLRDARDLLLDLGVRDCKLVVSSISPPLDEEAPPPLDRASATALELLRELRRRHNKLPWLFLASYDDGNRGIDLKEIDFSDVLAVGHVNRRLVGLARALTGETYRPVRKVDVNVDLVDGKYRWNLLGTSGTALETSGSIDIDENGLNLLAKESRAVFGRGRDGIGQLGLGIYLQFLADNFKSGLELALAKVIGERLEEARFRFCVDEATNDLLFEVLGKPPERNRNAGLEHWMLRTPIFRKFRGNGERHPLFKDHRSRREPINCLILQGDSAGFDAVDMLPGGDAVGKRYDPIAMADHEAQWLHGYLGDPKKKLNLKPTLLKPPAGGTTGYGELVRRTIRQGSWHMIHYVGHSDISANGSAYLALGGGKGNLLEIGELATLAREAQFVFLSSCESSNASFVMKLVAKNVPAVLGYAWPIDDGAALEFAKSFYRELFESAGPPRFLEYAFMRSKRAMHNADLQSVAWAAPLLFMQMLGAEAEHVH